MTNLGLIAALQLAVLEGGKQLEAIAAKMVPFEVNDITVVTTDGRRATADVVYSRGGGDLLTVRVEYTDLGRTVDGRPLAQLEGLPAECAADLADEIHDECREACAYQRDLNQAMN